MPPERQIYLLDPQSLDPETIAVAFAKTSRSPQSFRAIAAELNAEKSAQFHERWVVGYGHASVAEHAVLHVAIENMSRLAVETIESNRLASYTEKSTRYQKWSPDAFFTPPELEEDTPTARSLREVYESTCRALFETYLEALPAVRKDIERDYPRQPDESDGAWDRRIRSEYVDVCRFLLPAASLANLGMTINARALEHALRKMLSSPLAEVRQAGAEIKQAAMESVPTLLKYVDPVPYLVETSTELTERAKLVPFDGPTLFDEKSDNWCRLVACSLEGEARVLAAALYRFGGFSYTQSLQHIHSLGAEGREALAQLLFDRLGPHDIPLREAEYASYTFDLIIDQGGYFELKRHRMMTQTAQPLSTRLGYAVPRRIASAGMEGPYRRVMERAAQTYEKIAEHYPHVASYVVPNGYNRRVLLELNLRSADHFISLRSAPNAHFSIRRAALRMAEEIQKSTPLLARFLLPNSSETWKQVESLYFETV